MDKEIEELLEKERQEFAAMTPEELAAFEAKMKRADARAAAMIEGLNAYNSKKIVALNYFYCSFKPFWSVSSTE